MIIDKIENLSNYIPLNPLFGEIVDFLQMHSLNTLNVAKNILSDSDVRLNIDQTPAKSKEEARLEAHRIFIDIQIPINGSEMMGYTPLDYCPIPAAPYDAEKDIVFYDGPAQNYIKVEPGMFIIFFPEDAHAPCINTQSIKKAIFKVKTINK